VWEREEGDDEEETEEREKEKEKETEALGDETAVALPQCVENSSNERAGGGR
jgi:hypothetical protein